jgi:nucleolysin TIA-1/TIAR
MSIKWADAEEERLGIPSSLTWAEYITKEGVSYYWNSITGRTQWSRPKKGYIIPLDQTSQSNEVFVFYLPPEYQDHDLHQLFTSFGQIISAKVAFDKESGKSKGFGFVNFETSVSASNAVREMNGFSVLGKRLKVKFKKNS